jgi:hypothetical protein
LQREGVKKLLLQMERIKKPHFQKGIVGAKFEGEYITPFEKGGRRSRGDLLLAL